MLGVMGIQEAKDRVVDALLLSVPQDAHSRKCLVSDGTTFWGNLLGQSCKSIAKYVLRHCQPSRREVQEAKYALLKYKYLTVGT